MRKLALLAALAVVGCQSPAGQHDYRPLIAVAEGQAICQPLPPKAAECADCANDALSPAPAGLQDKPVADVKQGEEAAYSTSSVIASLAPAFTPANGPPPAPARVNAPVAPSGRTTYGQQYSTQRRGLFGRR